MDSPERAARLARIQSTWSPTEPKTAAVLGRRYHFHSGGIAYAVTTIVLVIGAVNAQNNLLFWLFGLGVAGLLISGILSGGSLMQLAIEREVGASASVGDEVILRYRLHNRSRVLPAYAITIEELESDKHASPTWPGKLTPPVAFAAYIPPQTSVVVETRVRAIGRGQASLGPLRVWTTFPFGLTKKSITFHQDHQILVRPWIAPLRQGLLKSASGTGDTGTLARRSRTGDEFYSLREFVHGDSLRSVAWRSTARLGRAVVREMAARPARRVWIVLCLDLAQRDNEQIISVGAALLDHARNLGYEPGIALGNGAVVEPPRPARKIDRLLDSLALLPVEASTPIAGESARLNAHTLADDGFVLVCSAGGGPEAIPGLRILIEDSTIYASGLPDGWHPSFARRAEAPALKWWHKLVTAWTRGGTP